MKKNIGLAVAVLVAVGITLTASTLTFSATLPQGSAVVEYELIATKKTSTFRKEINQAAAQGFRFERAMGGETSFGGAEMVAILSREPGQDAHVYEYKLLATNKTRTMQKELNREGEDGWAFVGHTSKQAAFRGTELISILERRLDDETSVRWEYKLLATKKTSTMRKELRQEAEDGYRLVDMIVTKSRFAGSEVVCVLRRSASGMEE